MVEFEKNDFKFFNLKIKKNISKQKFVYNYKYLRGDQRFLVLFTKLLKVSTRYFN